MSVFILDTDIMTLYQQGQPRVVEHVLTHPLPELSVELGVAAVAATQLWPPPVH